MPHFRTSRVARLETEYEQAAHRVNRMLRCQRRQYNNRDMKKYGHMGIAEYLVVQHRQRSGRIAFALVAASVTGLAWLGNYYCEASFNRSLFSVVGNEAAKRVDEIKIETSQLMCRISPSIACNR